MVHLAAQMGYPLRRLAIDQNVDFYTMDQSAEACDFLKRLNAELASFLPKITNIKDTQDQIRAYVTLCTPSYFFGLMGLARSLQKYSAIPLICLVDCDFDFDPEGNLENVYFVRVPRLVSSEYQPWRQEFSNVMSKLWVFGLSAFDKIVYLDSDICVCSNVDDLFNYPSPAFAPDYVDHLHTQRFNSGVFVHSPAMLEFCDILKTSRISHSYDGGDQGLLNQVFSGRHRWLPARYNMLRHQAYYRNGVTLDKDDVAIIHYIVKKPWEIKYREPCDSFLVELENQWTENLTKSDLLKLIQSWRKEIFILYERDRIATSQDIRKMHSANRRQVRFLALIVSLLIIVIFRTFWP